jgi:PTS system galactitol-specific IIB component
MGKSLEGKMGAKTKIKILSICGSGVVTSSMIGNKLKEMFGEKGYDVSTVEANPSELETYVMREKFDFIAFSSPIGDNHGVPALNAIGLITGMGEEKFLEDGLKILKDSGK